MIIYWANGRKEVNTIFGSKLSRIKPEGKRPNKIVINPLEYQTALSELGIEKVQSYIYTYLIKLLDPTDGQLLLRLL